MNKLILLILFSLSYCNAVIGQDSHIHFIEKPDSQKISIYIDQTLFTEFLYSDTLYKQVLYPIYTASGTEITRGYPARPKADERTDHPHQMGLWFSFGDINGLDFWNNSNRIPHNKKVQILLKKEDSITFTHQILIKDGDYLSNQEIENISAVQKSL